MCEGSVYSTFSLKFGVVSLFNFSHPGGCLGHLTEVLICMSLMTNDVDPLSCAHWSFLSSFVKSLFKCVAHFVIGLF